MPMCYIFITRQRPQKGILILIEISIKNITFQFSNVVINTEYLF